MKILHLLFLAPLFAVVTLAADSPAPAAAPPQLPPAPEKVAPPVVQADPAAVEAMLTALHFDEAMGKVANQQKLAVLGMTRQMIARMNLPGTSPEDLAAFEQKAIDTAWVGLSSEEIHAIAAKNYGEVFTTDELRAIANFYNSPAGQAFVGKQPQVQQKMGALLKPRMMQVVPKIQQMMRDFAAQQQDKAKKAADEAAMKAEAQKAAGTLSAPTAGASSVPVPAPAPAPGTPPKS